MRKGCLGFLVIFFVIAAFGAMFAPKSARPPINETAIPVAQRTQQAEVADPNTVSTPAQGDDSSKAPTAEDEKTIELAQLSHRYLRAFDECEDRAIVRGEDYTFALCRHIAGDAQNYAAAAGINYQMTDQDVKDSIHKKFVERVSETGIAGP